jgi:polyphosphate kinase
MELQPVALPIITRSPNSLLTRIRRRDLLVHHPYDAFKTSVEAFVASARDPKVAMLKGTVYRTGDPSRTLSSLVKAAEEGKQAVCLVELTARGDEEANIVWARTLETGVHVVYGVVGLKTHAKTVLVVRREGDSIRRYVHIGTGNYHATHATSYEDLGLLTANEEIAADVADVFNAVSGLATPGSFRSCSSGRGSSATGSCTRSNASHGRPHGQTARIRSR